MQRQTAALPLKQNDESKMPRTKKEKWNRLSFYDESTCKGKYTSSSDLSHTIRHIPKE